MAISKHKQEVLDYINIIRNHGFYVCPFKLIKNERRPFWKFAEAKTKQDDVWETVRGRKAGAAAMLKYLNDKNERLVVLDFDDMEQAEKFREEYPEQCKTLTVRSGSGRGLHFYFILSDNVDIVRGPKRYPQWSALDVPASLAFGAGGPHESGGKYQFVGDCRDIRKITRKEYDRMVGKANQKTRPHNADKKYELSGFLDRPEYLEKWKQEAVDYIEYHHGGSIQAGNRNCDLHSIVCRAPEWALSKDFVRDTVSELNSEYIHPPLPSDEIKKILNSVYNNKTIVTGCRTAEYTFRSQGINPEQAAGIVKNPDFPYLYIESTKEYMDPRLLMSEGTFSREDCRDSENFNRLNASKLREQKSSARTFADFLHENELIYTFKDFRYRPGASRVIEYRNNRYLNSYSPTDIQPVKPQSSNDTKWFYDLVNLVCGGNDQDANHVLDFIAFTVQNPEKKIRHGVLIISEQGIGKSTIGCVFAKLVGEQNTAFVHSDQILEQFNPAIENKKLLVLEEIDAGHKREVANRIKPWITESIVNIRAMRRDARQVENFANVIAFSNDQNPLYIDSGDRRWYVINVTANVRPAGRDFYDRVYNKMNDPEALGMLLHEMMSRNVDNFRPDQPPVLTEAKTQLINTGRTDVERIIYDAIKYGDLPDYFQQDALRQALKEAGYLQTHQDRHNSYLSEIIQKAGGVSKQIMIHLPDGRKRRSQVWIIRNEDKWAPGKGSRQEAEPGDHAQIANQWGEFVKMLNGIPTAAEDFDIIYQ